MFAVSAINTPRPITGPEHPHNHADAPDTGDPDADTRDVGEWPALLQQSLAMWERIFARQTEAPELPALPEATTDPSQGACALQGG